MTLEFDPHHAEIAKANIARAGLSHLVDLRVGAALDSLLGVAAEGLGPFDLIFIDADKPNNPHYLEWALKLSRPGTVIIGDNVVRDGAVVDADSHDQRVRGVRAFFDMLSTDPPCERDGAANRRQQGLGRFYDRTGGMTGEPSDRQGRSGLSIMLRYLITSLICESEAGSRLRPRANGAREPVLGCEELLAGAAELLQVE